MAVFRRMLERMYEDIDLTDELVDDEAKLLLKWGETEHERLDAAGVDLNTFEDRAKTIRRAIARMNRFVGQRSTYAEDEAQSKLAKLTESLYDLGYTISQEKVNAFLAAQKDMDNTSTLQAMLGLLNTEDTGEDTLQAQAAEVETETPDTGGSSALKTMFTVIDNAETTAEPASTPSAESAEIETMEAHVVVDADTPEAGDASALQAMFAKLRNRNSDTDETPDQSTDNTDMNLGLDNDEKI